MDGCLKPQASSLARRGSRLASRFVKKVKFFLKEQNEMRKKGEGKMKT